MKTNKRKIISIVSIVAIFVIAMAIFLVAVVMDIKENESKKQALVQNEQTENGNEENKDTNSQQEQGNENSSSNLIASSLTKPKAWEANENVTKYTDSEGNQAPIPKGYVVSEVNKEGLEENKISTGLVIYEGEEAVTNANVETAQKERNQYVWVPVPNPSEMYGIDENEKKYGNLYDFGTSTSPKNPPEVISRSSTSYREPDILKYYDKDSKLKTSGLGIKTMYEFEIQLEKEFNEMIASVEKYGGFYIGRYETGNLSKAVPVVVKENEDISEQTWYMMYQKSKKLAGASSNVRTSMIWGCQWDRTLKWLVESGNKTYSEITNSTSWGNYNNSTGSAEIGKGSKRPTGYNEAWKANNIYDMAGNVWDWTIEANSYNIRIRRRGLLP